MKGKKKIVATTRVGYYKGEAYFKSIESGYLRGTEQVPLKDKLTGRYKITTDGSGYEFFYIEAELIVPVIVERVVFSGWGPFRKRRVIVEKLLTPKLCWIPDYAVDFHEVYEPTETIYECSNKGGSLLT